MNSSTNISKRERILGGLWGSLTGDALGVPMEFKDRACILSSLGAPASANSVGAEINGVHQKISLHPVSKITTKWQAPAFLPA